MIASVALLALHGIGGGRQKVSAPPSIPVVVTTSPLSPNERARLSRERESAVQRDDGVRLSVVKRGEFLFMIERDLLPEELLRTRLATLAALRRTWAPGRAVSLSGEGAESYESGIVAQLPAQERRDLAASGAFQLHRSADIVLSANGRTHLVTLDRRPPLGDEVYPAGAGASARSAEDERSAASTRAASRPLPPSRSAEMLAGVPAEVQARAFGAAFAYIAEQWRTVGERLKAAHREFDEALDADLAARNPFGLPKTGTEWKDLDPKLQAKVDADLALNWKAYGFESESDASAWIRGAKVQQSFTNDVCGFGRFDQGRGGAYMPVRLFTP